MSLALSKPRSRCYRPKASKREVEDGETQTNTVGNAGDDRDFAGIRSFRSGSHGTGCCGEFPASRRCVDPARFFDCLSGIAVSYIKDRSRGSQPFNTAKMFYDLNVPYSSDDPEISHTLNFLAESTSLARSYSRFFGIQDHMRS